MSAALESLFDGSLTGTRLQRIHTPPEILRAIALLWPEGIALDPSGSPDGLVVAERIVIPPDNGLVIDWPERTYSNPPYDDLERWLRKYGRAWECVVLVPKRTHRKWFRAAERVSSQVVDLDPVTFWASGHRHGQLTPYPCAFPAPLTLLYRGNHDLQSIAEACGLVDNYDGGDQTLLFGEGT